jgi:cytochrome c
MRNRKLSLRSTRVIGAVLSTVVALAISSSPGIAAGDAAAGERDFRTTCAACHSTEPGVNKIGPSLHGIVGSKSGAVPGYNFSPALKAADITWDETTLDKFIQNPGADVHGTKMVLSVPNAQTRQDIIAYLETLKP